MDNLENKRGEALEKNKLMTILISRLEETSYQTNG